MTDYEKVLKGWLLLNLLGLPIYVVAYYQLGLTVGWVLAFMLPFSFWYSYAYFKGGSK